MKNFIRYSKKRIVDTETRRPTAEKMIYLRYKKGEVASYKDAHSGEDLLTKLINKFEAKKYAARYSKKQEESDEYGSSKPLNDVKYYTCSSCENPTPNRFRCSPCWEKISHISAGVIDEDNYYLGDNSAFSESFD